MRTYYKMSCYDYVELLEHYLEWSHNTANSLRYNWSCATDPEIIKLIETIIYAENQIKAIEGKWWPEGVDKND